MEQQKRDSFIAAQQQWPIDDPKMDGIEQPVDTGKVPCGKLRLTDIEAEANRHMNDFMFHSITTNGMERWEGHFTRKDEKQLLVSLPGSANGSSGNAQNMAMLLSCSDPTHAIWASQVGDLQVIDLNGDGLMEIVESVNIVWMGACNDFYEIYTFRNGKKETMISRESLSRVNCGGETDTPRFSKGDTVSNMYDCRLTHDPLGNWQVMVIHEYAINKTNSKTEKEIVPKLTYQTDTNFVTFK